MGILAILSFILCPLLSIPIICVGLKGDKKYKNIYLLIIAIFIALFSYSYKPTSIEDLYRHHDDVVRFENASSETLQKELSTQPEQISVIYKYIISKTGNVDLLQFFTTIICYYILFYILSEYSSKHKNVKGAKLFSVWFFVLSGFHFLVITSGIFYTLSLEIFSLGIYFDYVLNKKIASKIFYILPVFIHTCAILPLAMVILYKILGSKNNIRAYVLLATLILSIDVLLATIVPNVDLPIINEISNLYRAYFNNEGHWEDLHTVPVLVMYLSRLVPILIGYKISKRREAVSDFAVFMTIAILILYFQTSFSIRYIHIAVLCGVPLLFTALEDEKKGQMFCVMLYSLAVPHIIYQIKQFLGLGRFENIHEVLVTNIVTTLLEK